MFGVRIDAAITAPDTNPSFDSKAGLCSTWIDEFDGSLSFPVNTLFLGLHVDTGGRVEEIVNVGHDRHGRNTSECCLYCGFVAGDDIGVHPVVQHLTIRRTGWPSRRPPLSNDVCGKQVAAGFNRT
jgi:hypothetical protein